MDSIYKVLRQNEWLKLKNSGEFQGSPDDLKDGYIHLSTKEQVEHVVEKYFKDEPVIYVAEFSPDSFDPSDLKWELSPSSKKVYPHLYNSFLNFEGVISHRVINNQ
tara:strand:- start:20097 stop:20414 length:318 start_codon:yes stop_codon:yes gene_type:complete